jgi:long-chain acyl-CoA synthetase
VQDVRSVAHNDARNVARNVAELVRRSAAAFADRQALRWHDRVVTWAQLDMQVDAVAHGLSVLGLTGDGKGAPRVAIALPNVPEFAAVYFGALRAGLVAVPINPTYTRREFAHVLADSGAQVLIATDQVLDTIGDDRPAHTYALGQLGELHGSVDAEQAGSLDASRPRPAQFAEQAGSLDASRPRPAQFAVNGAAGGEDLAVLLYTSGTSGVPKGAMLSHRALLANHEQLARLDPAPVGPDDVLLLALPLFHAYGLNSGLGAIAYHGACGVLVERFDPADTLDLIARHGVTCVIGVPPMYVAWSLMGSELASAFETVQLAVSGAAPLDQAAARRFTEATGKPMHEGYGLTETAPVLTSTLASPAPKVGSIGRPIPGVDLKLVDPGGVEIVLGEATFDDEDDFDDEAAGSRGDPGQIVVRGANLFSGYWPDGNDGPDEDGWWATGDIAYVDSDGDLFLVDRLGELILVSGFNVYPHEVELVLDGHPAVAESAAVGVAHPYTGQTVKAYVVRAAAATVTGEELIAYCEGQLARFKCPTAVEFVTELPRSLTGKVRKVALEKRVPL